MPAAPIPNPKSEVPAERPKLIARVAALPLRAISGLRHRPLLAVVLLSGLGIIGSSAVSVAYYYFLRHNKSLEAGPMLERALSALDAGQYEEARNDISQLPNAGELVPEEQGQPLFIMGAVIAQEAALRGHNAEGRALYLVAARYLQEARDHGFPPGREAQGLTLLGQCLFQSGRYAESLPALREAAQVDTHNRFELYRLLAIAYLQDAVPNLKAALQYNQRALEDTTMGPQQREEAILQQSQILLRLGDVDACRKALASIAADSPLRDQVLVIEARCLIREGVQSAASAAGTAGEGEETNQEKFREAVSVLQQAQGLDEAGDTTRQTLYLLGVCYRHTGDNAAAWEIFDRTGKTYYGTDEALAAELNEAEIAQAQGNHDKAMELYTKVIEEAANPSLYSNAWISLEELRSRLSIAQQQFQLAHQFVAALALTDACAKILPVDERTEIEAQAHQAWAEFLLRDAKGRGRLGDAVTEAEARGHFRAAADAYQRLTTLRYTTNHYPNDLWLSGECYLRGQNYETAITMLRQFLQNAPRAQHPQGLVALGECQLALGRFHEALLALEQCIESYPKHPEGYQARLLASQAYQQLNQRTEAKPGLPDQDNAKQQFLDKAKQLLRDNMQNTELTPQSLQWQRSLFAYGTLLFNEGMALDSLSRVNGVDSPDPDLHKKGLNDLYAANKLFLEAIRYLDEAVQRYPDAPEASAAFYNIAEAYRHAAKLPDKSLLTEPTLSRRAEFTQKRREWLESAADVHFQLQTRLLEKQRQNELSEIEQAILRNTYFAYADTLFYLNDYEQAIKAYLAASNRYQHAPEALEAFVQMASCYRHLKAPAEARGTLLQAKAVLARINKEKDMDFEKTTPNSREEWQQLLSWLSQL
ncbi:MAG: tetratricopeptide repeat protein [Pirellulaceae bacterium]